MFEGVFVGEAVGVIVCEGVGDAVRVLVAVADEKEEGENTALGLERGEVEALSEETELGVCSDDLVALPLGSGGEVATGEIEDVCEVDTVEAGECERLGEVLCDIDREVDGDAVRPPVLDCTWVVFGDKVLSLVPKDDEEWVTEAVEDKDWDKETVEA